jgi:prepilin-type N-terminal cleavage/methylation domain-containing protein
MKNGGFTLIELIIVVGIFLLLVALVVPALVFFKRQSLLDSTAQEIFNTLRLAQNKTLSSEGASSFGVYFETNKFTLFKGAVYSAGAPDNEIHNLDTTLRISEINLGGSQVVFDRLSGTTANSGFLKIESVQDSTKNKYVYIENSGTVSLSSVSASDASRFKDSRHIHVLYSQNTQSAANLVLYFSNDNFTQNINYQNGLNADKTQFFWEGTVTVGGVDQKLKIHTHSLTASATQFCFHRDRRFNSKALNISLDGQNLINYTATGTTTKGISLWASDPQIQ